ncbi:MAG: DUF3662 domain-containing protein [Firmicutes bacterium]|nr:DUF3662 domain-containing protein [Bacillota bacterium]
MSLLRDFEQRIESLLEGFFVRQFKSGVQPVEIAKKLVREMDTHRSISVSKVYVPNRYTIIISEKDAERLKPFEKTLISEFQDFLLTHAKREGYEIVGTPRIDFNSSPELTLGEIIIKSSLESRDTAASQVDAKAHRKTQPIEKHVYLLRAGGGSDSKFLLPETTTKIGRSSDNSIVIPDPNVSRHHATVEKIGSQYILKDLDSTNGTFVNGMRVGERILKHGDVITIGTTKLQFRRESGV